MQEVFPPPRNSSPSDIQFTGDEHAGASSWAENCVSPGKNSDLVWWTSREVIADYGRKADMCWEYRYTKSLQVLMMYGLIIPNIAK